MLSSRVMQASGIASAFLAGFSSPGVFAVEPMESNELVASCQSYAALPGSAEGALCRGYLQGLLSGTSAVSTDSQQSALVNRATQTRASHLITRVQNNSTSQEFCLPPEVSVNAIIEHLVYDSRESEFNALPADVLVAATLARHFPCSPTE